MNQTERITFLEQENLQLKHDNEMLLAIIAQLKLTLNRLIKHYITNDHEEESA